jgi:chemotaxis protein CheC
MIGKHISLNIPEISIIDPDELETELSGTFNRDALAAVRLGFRGEFSGVTSIVFPPESAQKLVNVLTDNDLDYDEDMDALRIGTLSEVGNIVINGVMGSISNMMSLHLNYSLPTYQENDLPIVLSIKPAHRRSPILLAQTHFRIAELKIEGVIYVMLEGGSFNLLMKHINLLME